MLAKNRPVLGLNLESKDMERSSLPPTNPETINPAPVKQEGLYVKVAREAELLLHGTAIGIVNHGVDSLKENPLTFAAAVGTGVAMSAAMKGPSVIRTPALILGTVMTGKFLVDGAAAVSECIPAVAETWKSDIQFEEKKQTVARNMGPLAFDVVFAAVAGKLTAQGLRLGSRIMNDTAMNLESFGFGRTLAYQHPRGASSVIGSLVDKPNSAGSIFMSERDFLRPRIRSEIETYWGRRFKGDSRGSELKEIDDVFTKEILLQMFREAGQGSKVDGARKFLKEVYEIKPSLTYRLNEPKPRALHLLNESDSLTREESIAFAHQIVSEENLAYFRSLRNIPRARTSKESEAMARKSIAEEVPRYRKLYKRGFERMALREVKESERDGIAKIMAKPAANSQSEPDGKSPTTVAKPAAKSQPEPQRRRWTNGPLQLAEIQEWLAGIRKLK